MTDVARSLESIMERVRADFVAKNHARETALPLSREAIRFSANAIRAVHRREFDLAGELVGKARAQLDTARRSLDGHQDIYNAGFVHDAQKEYAEASITLALIAGREFPTPSSSTSSTRRSSTAWARPSASCGVTCSTRCAAATSSSARSG